MTDELRINAVDVAVLKLERGDVLAILTDKPLSAVMAGRIGQTVNRAVAHIPGVRVLVFDTGLTPTIIRGDGFTDTPPKESRPEGVTGADSPGPPVGSCSGEGTP